MGKTKEQISLNMKAVKNKDSQIELLLRKELWSRGLRYRKNSNKGEWSEIYVFLRALAVGKLYAADENLNKVDDVFYNIIKTEKYCVTICLIVMNSRII